MNSSFRFLFSTILAFNLALPVNQAFAQQACRNVHLSEVERHQQTLSEYLVSNKVPAVSVEAGGKKIPVILMNQKTAPLLKDLLMSSVGTVAAHQKGYTNDHGLFRVEDQVIDLDRPGSRARGEIHGTGISWVDLYRYIDQKSKTNRVEVVYKLSKQELKVARLYHLLRRSAILRVTYAYAGFKQDGTLPNLLTQSGEHCFTFCASTHLNNQVREIKQRLEEKNVGSFDQLIGRPDILTWLENVKVALESPQIGRGQKLINFLKERLLNIAASPNVENLSPQLPLKVGIPSSLEKMETFQKMDQGQQQETLNWIVAGALASDYLKLTTELGFRNTGNGFQGKNNPRATAILIYDSKVSAENFLQSDYRSEGVFSTWTNLGTEPIH